MPHLGEASAPVDTPVLIEAINLTFRTLERRTRLYRNLVIAVSLTAVGSILVAVVLRRWVFLVGGLALPLYVNGFLILDRRTVMKWRSCIFRMRDERDLQITHLTQTFAEFRHLPQATLRSMLALLNSGRA